MEQNYHVGKEGLQINTLLAASAWNLKKMMEKTQRRVFLFEHYS
ncbi:MAG TPA: hypothetical protein PLE52_07910 [Paludibacteraceae bacterium]|nr:hypothetical protein [Paludibacteraceae bacterium]